jgi:hypothetical protein
MKKFLFIILLCSNAVFAQQKQGGIIYTEHPFIGVVKQLAKLYAQGNPNGMAKLFADTVHFYGMTLYKPDTARLAKSQKRPGKTLTEAKKGWQDIIDNWEGIKIVPTTPLIGLKYTASSSFKVQSEWLLTVTNKKTKKTAYVQIVLFDYFDGAGKISRQIEYYDPTPLILAARQ